VIILSVNTNINIQRMINYYTNDEKGNTDENAAQSDDEGQTISTEGFIVLSVSFAEDVDVREEIVVT